MSLFYGSDDVYEDDVQDGGALVAVPRTIRFDEINKIFEDNLKSGSSVFAKDDAPMSRQAFENFLAEFIPRIEDALQSHDSDMLNSVLDDVVDSVSSNRFGAGKKVYKCVQPYTRDQSNKKEQANSCQKFDEEMYPDLKAFSHIGNCRDECYMGNEKMFMTSFTEQDSSVSSNRNKLAMVIYENRTLATLAKLGTSLFVASLLFVSPRRPFQSGLKNSSTTTQIPSSQHISTLSTEIVNLSSGAVNVTGFNDTMVPGMNVTATTWFNQTLVQDPPRYSNTTEGKAFETSVRAWYRFGEKQTNLPQHVLPSLTSEAADVHTIPQPANIPKQPRFTIPRLTPGWNTTLQISLLAVSLGFAWGLSNGFQNLNVNVLSNNRADLHINRIREQEQPLQLGGPPQIANELPQEEDEDDEWYFDEQTDTFIRRRRL